MQMHHHIDTFNEYFYLQEVMRNITAEATIAPAAIRDMATPLEQAQEDLIETSARTQTIAPRFRFGEAETEYLVYLRKPIGKYHGLVYRHLYTMQDLHDFMLGKMQTILREKDE